MDTAQMFFLMIIIVVTASLSLVGVIMWLAARMKEREDYYRSEILKKIADSPSSTTAIEYLREADRITARRNRGGLRLGGLVAMSIGIGLMVFLRTLNPESGIYMVGVIPLLVGVSLFGYSQFMMPRE